LNYLFREFFSARLYYTSQTNQIGKLVILDNEDVLKQAETANNFLDVKKWAISSFTSLYPLSHFVLRFVCYCSPCKMVLILGYTIDQLQEKTYRKNNG